MLHNSTLKVLIVSDLFPPAGFGGVPVAVHNLVSNLVKLGVAVVVAAGGHKEEVEEKEGYKVYRLKNLSFPLYRHAPIVAYFGSKIKQIIEKEKPEVIHIELLNGIGVASLYEARKRHISTVFTLHTLPENANQLTPNIWPLNSAFDWLFWKWVGSFAAKVDVVTAPSQYAISVMTSRFKLNKAVRVSNGIDLDEFKRQHSVTEAKERLSIKGKKLLLYVGRLHHEKSPDVLIKAVPEVVKKHTDAYFVLVGEGPMRFMLTQLAKELQVDKYVSLPGFVEQNSLKYYYEAADVFVMPSTQELQGLSVMEAMVNSVPVIVANAKALPELVEEGKNGYSFEPNNPEDLASKIVKLIDQPNICNLGNYSHELVLQHDIKETAKKYEDIYIELVKSKQIVKTSTS